MGRQRVTVTLDPSLIQAADSLVDGATIRNRSHAIEVLISEGLGLSDLSTLIIVLDQNWSSTIQSLKLISAHSWKQVYAIPIGAEADTALTTLAILFPNVAIQRLPGEFGDGGALTLLKGTLTSTCLITWITPEFRLPVEGLTPAFTFHRQHHNTVTLLINQNGAVFTSIGCALCGAELADAAPAGKSSIIADIFPSLQKQGRVKAYVCR